jgi:hypothetical protein
MAGIQGLIGAAPRYARMLRSQYWAPEKLDRYVEASLTRSLAAAMRIPFYRLRLNGLTPQAGELQSLPILPARSDSHPLGLGTIVTRPSDRSRHSRAYLGIHREAGWLLLRCSPSGQPVRGARQVSARERMEPHPAQRLAYVDQN